MSQMKLIRYGAFGRVAILDLEGPLVEHAHSHGHLLFWLGGDFDPIHVGNDKVCLDSSHAVAINSWEPHSVVTTRSKQRGMFLLFYLDPVWLTNCCVKLGVSVRFTRPSFKLTKELQGLLKHFTSLLLSEQCNINLELYICELLEAAMRSMQNSSDPAIISGESSSFMDFRIRKAVDYMRLNLEMRENFEDVAREAGLSRPHFFTLFRKHMRMTPSVFWNTIRMENAIENLIRTDKTLSDLSFDLGFSEPANFSRFFRNHSGVCPSQYRLVAGGQTGAPNFGPIST